jgi:hypothetical protein
MWWLKFIVCILVDIFDFTVGRVLFLMPFSGEMIGCFIGYLMFGSSGLLYALEALDPTEQIDGFIPTATLIALSNKSNKSNDV